MAGREQAAQPLAGGKSMWPPPERFAWENFAAGGSVSPRQTGPKQGTEGRQRPADRGPIDGRLGLRGGPAGNQSHKLGVDRPALEKNLTARQADRIQPVDTYQNLLPQDHLR
jgi:hypothetical protein